MKKTFLTFGVMLAACGVFAQGKTFFGNDSLHLVYFSTDSYWLLPGELGAAGSAYNGSMLSDGGFLVADLYAGTSASSLSLLASGRDFASSGIAGEWNPQNVTVPWAPGTTNYFQILVHDSRWSGLVGPSGQGYWGETPVFMAVSGAFAPYHLAQNDAPAYSTWAQGDFPMNSPFVGGAGAIELRYGIPEPSALALAGLGLVTLLGRKRKAGI